MENRGRIIGILLTYRLTRFTFAFDVLLKIKIITDIGTYTLKESGRSVVLDVWSPGVVANKYTHVPKKEYILSVAPSGELFANETWFVSTLNYRINLIEWAGLFSPTRIYTGKVIVPIIFTVYSIESDVRETRRWMRISEISDEREPVTAAAITRKVRDAVDIYSMIHSHPFVQLHVNLKKPNSLVNFAGMVEACLETVRVHTGIPNLAFQPIITILIPGNHAYSFSGRGVFDDMDSAVYGLSGGCYRFDRTAHEIQQGTRANFCLQLVPWGRRLCNRCITVVDINRPIDLEVLRADTDISLVSDAIVRHALERDGRLERDVWPSDVFQQYSIEQIAQTNAEFAYNEEMVQRAFDIHSPTTERRHHIKDHLVENIIIVDGEIHNRLSRLSDRALGERRRIREWKRRRIHKSSVSTYCVKANAVRLTELNDMLLNLHRFLPLNTPNVRFFPH